MAQRAGIICGPTWRLSHLGAGGAKQPQGIGRVDLGLGNNVRRRRGERHHDCSGGANPMVRRGGERSLRSPGIPGVTYAWY
jgi:hypothetical protein